MSVPLVGWSHCRAIGRICETHIVTQVRNRDAFVRAGLSPQDFTAIDNEAIARPLWRIASWLRGGEGKGWTTLMLFKVFGYRSFEKLLWRRFGADIVAKRYDVVHRVTPLSPTVPSRLATWCRKAGVPFVLGPLNGGVPWPKGFDHARRREREWLSYVRGAYRLLPSYASTRRDAAALVVGSRDTWRQMPEKWRDKTVYLPENAIDPVRMGLDQPLSPRAPGPLRVVFLGRLVPYKGADMLLDSVADLVRAGKVTVDILGDGPEMPRLRAMATELRIETGVTFCGWVPHDQVASTMAKADVLGFPSVREFGGGVVLEAMAAGLVPVVLDYGGPGELVSPRTGFALPIGSRQQIVERFRETFAALAGDLAQLTPLRQAARERVRSLFTWDAKARQTERIYEWVTGRGPKPDFGMPMPD